MSKIREFVVKHQELFTILGLGILFYFIFFHNIWAYALMDVDESRYVSMSKDMFNTKDFLTLYLNNEFFFEKPPLYFWGECLSFALFGKITEFTARFPVALYGTLCGFLTYFIGRKIISRSYGVVSALILSTSLEFLILSKFAILDIVVATCVWFSLCFGILTTFCEEKNRKYFWWLFYIFSGLAVMAKGIPGFVVPFGSLFFIYIFNSFLAKHEQIERPLHGEGCPEGRRGLVIPTFKTIFKPQYFLAGFVLFFLITLPWHIVMLKIHDPLFFQEYVIKHHIARFLGSNEIGRQQPFYFYFLTILWGFFPWIISTLVVFIRKCIKRDFVFAGLTDTQRFLVYNGIIAIFTLLFFSSSKTKLITYILPIYPSLACLGGYIWTKYIEKGEYSRFINKTVYVLGGIFILASIIAIFTPLFLPAQLVLDISSAKSLCITLLFASGLASILFAKKERYLGVFFSYVLLMLVLSAFGTEKFFKIDYKFGQDDLLKYAQIAKKENKTLTCYRFTHKYSLIYYGGKPVEFLGKESTPADLKTALEKPNNLVIIPHKAIDTEVESLNYKAIEDGRKYTLVERK